MINKAAGFAMLLRYAVTGALIVMRAPAPRLDACCC